MSDLENATRDLVYATRSAFIIVTQKGDGSCTYREVHGRNATPKLKGDESYYQLRKGDPEPAYSAIVAEFPELFAACTSTA